MNDWTGKTLRAFRESYPRDRIGRQWATHPNRDEFAAILGVHRRTLQRWETGVCSIPGPAKALLSLLQAQQHLCAEAQG